MIKGEITIGWVVGFMATTLVAATSSMLGSVYMAAKAADAKAEEVRKDVALVNVEQDKQIATLIEAVGTIKEVNKQTGADIGAIRLEIQQQGRNNQAIISAINDLQR